MWHERCETGLSQSASNTENVQHLQPSKAFNRRKITVFHLSVSKKMQQFQVVVTLSSVSKMFIQARTRNKTGLPGKVYTK